MSQLPRYESYKDSGVQWLGEIPNHWSTMAVRRILEEHRQGYYTNEPYIDDGVKLARITDIQQTSEMDLDNSPRVENKAELKEFFLKENDFLFARTGGAGSFGIVRQKDLPAVYASYLIRFRFKENIEAEYLKFFFKSSYFLNSLVANIHGGVNQNIHAEDIKSTFLALPPVEEQKKIANFLNNKVEKVNALIAKQETLLEKLAEQRVALISHAVTKGLNPDVEMKETGISWFKQIPKSWDIKQLKFVITKIQTGSTPPSAVPEYYSSDDIVWYGPADFTDENYILNESVKKISALALEDKVVKPMPKGSIMMIGIGATLGKVAITNVDCTTNQQINSLISIEDVNAKYLMYQLNSLRDIVKLLSSASTLGIINQEKTKCLKIIVPSLNDQNEIVEFLDKELNEISAVKKSVEQTINKLKEYRSTLITQVVTGKIDVRNLKVN